jgi:hypothetical protein
MKISNSDTKNIELTDKHMILPLHNKNTSEKLKIGTMGVTRASINSGL